MSDHTPGPWTLEAGRNFKTASGDFYITYGKDRYGNPLWKGNFAELDDNARLIAAAPEMLECLRELTIDHETDCPALSSGPYTIGACDCVAGYARQNARALLARIEGG